MNYQRSSRRPRRRLATYRGQRRERDINQRQTIRLDMNRNASPSNRVSDLAQLQALIAQEHTAHVNHDAHLLVSLFSDDFINLGDGAISRPSRGESLAHFQAYFDRSTFLAWDDIEPPIIRLSADGSLAYAIIHKRVQLLTTGPGIREQTHETIFAWLEIWERNDGRWQLQVVASTRSPTETGDPA